MPMRKSRVERGVIPERTTIPKFTRLPDPQNFAIRILEAVDGHLGRQGLPLRQITITDAPIIQALSSTRNRTNNVIRTYP